MTMRLLVTGASGFVGRGLLPYLAGHGIGGVATGRHAPANLPAGWMGCTRADVLARTAGGEQIDAVVHLEVRHHVPRPTPDDAADFERVNVGNTQEWLEWAGRAGVRRFVFVSSIKAVSPALGSRHDGLLADAQEPYGSSKAAAEQAVRDWASASAERAAVILRAAPVYGPGNKANLAAFARQVMQGRMCLVGDGGTLKAIVSRTNLAAAIMFTATNARPGCDGYNVSDPAILSLAEIAGLISRLAGAPPPRAIPAALATVIARVGDAVETLTGWLPPLTTPRLRAIREMTVFPCGKLVAAGFSHPQTTEQGLAEMVESLRDPGRPV
jgi:nucleoside-diphosphate-sugar epimerase